MSIIHNSTKNFLIIIVILIIITFPKNAFASSLLVWPIRPVINHNSDATSLWLENRSSKPLTLQIRILQWQHDLDGQRYALQSQVISSPPFVTIAGNDRQLIRIHNRVAVPNGKELSWRIIIDELPNASQSVTQTGVNFRIRYSLPLFAYGSGALNPSAATPTEISNLVMKNSQWHISSDTNLNESYLYIQNSSEFNWRISDLLLFDDNNEVVITHEGLQGYLLPGATRKWKLGNEIKSINSISFLVHGTNIHLERK